MTRNLTDTPNTSRNTDKDWNCSTFDGAEGSICYKQLLIRKCFCSGGSCLWTQRKIRKIDLSVLRDEPLISRADAKPVTVYMSMDEFENLTF